MRYYIEKDGVLSAQSKPSTLFTIEVISSETSCQVLELSAVYCTPYRTRRIHFYGTTAGSVAHLIGDLLRPGMIGVDAAFILSVMLEAGPAATMISIPRKKGVDNIQSLNAALKDAVAESGISPGPTLAAMPLVGGDGQNVFSSFSKVINALDPGGDLHVLAAPFCSGAEGVIRVALFSRPAKHLGDTDSLRHFCRQPKDKHAPIRR